MKNLFYRNDTYFLWAVVCGFCGCMLGGILFQEPGMLPGTIFGSYSGILYAFYRSDFQDNFTREMTQMLLHLGVVGVFALLFSIAAHLAVLLAVGLVTVSYMLARRLKMEGVREPIVWLFFGSLPIVGIPTYWLWLSHQKRKHNRAP